MTVVKLMVGLLQVMQLEESMYARICAMKIHNVMPFNFLRQGKIVRLTFIWVKI
jgi:hypothetical protein